MENKDSENKWQPVEDYPGWTECNGHYRAPNSLQETAFHPKVQIIGDLIYKAAVKFIPKKKR